MTWHWKPLGPTWRSEDIYRVMELLKENRIRFQMPADDMFFTSPFHLPCPDLRWSILVKRRDWSQAVALLAGEGLVNGKTLSDPSEK